MNTSGPDDPSSKPPISVVNEAIETIEIAEGVDPSLLKTVTHVGNAVGPGSIDNYQEPISLADLRKRRDEIDPPCASTSMIKLLDDALAKIEALETAVAPLCVHGMMMANARMCLVQLGRAKEPAGGTWVSGTSSIQMQPTESLFFDMIDAVGRGRVERHMMQLFNEVQEKNAAAAEKNAHVEGSTLQGPVGGPVGGRVH